MKPARGFSFKMKFCAHSFFYHHHNKDLRINAMMDENNTGNFTATIEGPSIASSGIQSFCFFFIDKNTTIGANFAQKYYQYHKYFDLTMIQQLQYNLPHSHQTPINSYNNYIGRVTKMLSTTLNKIVGFTYTI